MKLTIAVVAVAIAAIACAPSLGEDYKELGVVVARSDLSAVIRVEDEEAGVVCWVYNSNAIDCLPLGCTLLWEEEG